MVDSCKLSTMSAVIREVYDEGGVKLEKWNDAKSNKSIMRKQTYS
jgi:hypothetical protein